MSTRDLAEGIARRQAERQAAAAAAAASGNTAEDRTNPSVFLNARSLAYADAGIPDDVAYKLAQRDLVSFEQLPPLNVNWPDKPPGYEGEWKALYQTPVQRRELISRRNELINTRGRNLRDAQNEAIEYVKEITDIVVDDRSKGTIKVPTGRRDANRQPIYTIASCDDVRSEWEWYADYSRQAPPTPLTEKYNFCISSNVSTTWGATAAAAASGAAAVAEARNQRGDPKCPEGWEASLTRSSNLCVQKCPAPYKFYEIGIGKEESGTVNRNPMCVYPDNDKVWVQVDSRPKVPAAMAALLRLANVTYKDLSGMDTELFDSYRRTTRSFNRDIRAANAKLTERERVDRAFKDMQAKEESRDEDPDAYEAARSAYYTLTSGTGWADAERERVAKTEVAPVLKEYDNKFAEVDSKHTEYNRVVELINKFRTQVMQGREDLSATLDAVYKHLGNAKSQVNIQKRLAHEQTSFLAEWFDTILNVLLVIVILVGCIMIAYKYMFKPKTIPTLAVRV